MKSKSESPKTFASYPYYLEKDYDQSGNKQFVGNGEVFITGKLTNKFMETMNTLKYHFRLAPDIHVCINSITHRLPTSKRGEEDVLDIIIFVTSNNIDPFTVIVYEFSKVVLIWDCVREEFQQYA